MLLFTFFLVFARDCKWINYLPSNTVDTWRVEYKVSVSHVGEYEGGPKKMSHQIAILLSFFLFSCTRLSNYV